MTRSSWREFTDIDWMGLAGAERFDDGSEPLIREDLTVDGLEATAILDNNGFGIMWASVDGDDEGHASMRYPYAGRWLALLGDRTALTTAEFERNGGFEMEINGFYVEASA